MTKRNLLRGIACLLTLVHLGCVQNRTKENIIFGKLPVNTSWLSCQKDDDCIIVKDYCAFEYTINKSTESEFYKLLNSNRQISCGGPSLNVIKNVKCLDYRCMASP